MAWLFHRLLALVFLIAWVSLGVQVEVLIGSRGLLPIAPFLDSARTAGTLPVVQFPTIFWLGDSDVVLIAGIWVGVALSLVALAGVWPRLCFALMTGLYLSYATAARTFLSFQWDNLLLECGALAVLLPTDRPARWIHLLFRLLLFKLYWESGVAKWQSHLGDWQDGSAMTSYYETAPLPTWPAWYAHALPVWWHHFESWSVLAVELVLPFGIFGQRWLRLFCAAVFTWFQILNAATANYGFFCYLSAALGVFLLDDADVEPIRRWITRRRPRWIPESHARSSSASLPRPPWRRWASLTAIAVVATLYVTISAADAWLQFSPSDFGKETLVRLTSLYGPWRLVNTYHLFGHITRERIEPEFQTSADGVTWVAHELRHKPGDPRRAPDFVAPHQPRVDFQLWFYGLGFRRNHPAYVLALVDRLCQDPAAVQPLFTTALPEHPQAARIVFWQYHFTEPDDADTAAWWRREEFASTQPVSCR